MKIFKRIVPLFLALCMTGITVFSACTNNNNDDDDHKDVTTPVDDPAKNGYTITVTYPDGTPVDGTTDGGTDDRGRPLYVFVQLSDANGFINDEFSYNSYATVNAYGSARFKCTPGEYTVTLVNCPKGYQVSTAKTSADKEGVSIVLANNMVTYKTSVTYPDGSAANGVNVNMTGGHHDISAVTGSDGVATLEEVVSGTYRIAIKAPEGYAAKSYVTAATDATEAHTVANVNIELVPVTMLTLETALTQEEKDLIANARQDEDGFSGYNSNDMKIFNTDVDSYQFTTDVAYGEEKIYTFVPEYTATYSLYIHPRYKNSRNSGYSISILGNDLGDNLQTPELGNASLGNGTGKLIFYATENVPVYFSCSKLTDNTSTYDFIISKPDFSQEIFATTAPGDYELTMRSGSQYISFSPNMSGVYEITSKANDYDTKLQMLSNSLDVLDENDDGGDGKNFKFKIEVQDSYVGNNYRFKIFVNKLDGSEAEYPAVIPFSITRTGDATPEESIRVIPVTTANTQKFSGNGQFNWLPLDGSIRPHEDGNGNWYVTVNGAERRLLVAISKNLYDGRTLSTPPAEGSTSSDPTDTSISFATIQYMGGSSATPNGSEDDSGIKNNYLTVNEADLTGSTRYDYTAFIDTYSGYKNGKPVAGEGLCNSDGLYYVNAELHLFLKRYFAYGPSSIGDGNIYSSQGHALIALFDPNAFQILDNGCGWYVACGYYL